MKESNARANDAAPSPLKRSATTARLSRGPYGGLDRMTWTPLERTAPGAGEVEVEIEASGLNFRDLMWAMSLLPEEILEDGFAGPTLGLESAGRVVRVGEGVTAFKPGQKDSATNREEAERLLKSFAAGKACAIVTDALPGDAVKAILQVAGEVDADLIVVGNKGMRGAGRLLGSVPNSVTHKAPCSVLVVKTT